MLDFLEQLERINRQFPGARLLVDLARDSGLELTRRLARRVKGLRVSLEKAESRQHDIQARLVDLLHELSTSTALLPLAPDQPAEEAEPFIQRFRHLRDEEYPAMAREIRELHDQGSRRAIMRFFTEEILYRAAPIIAEHRLRHSQRPWNAEGEKHFIGELRLHVAGKVNKALVRSTGLKLTPAIAKHLDGLIGNSLDVLAGLMTATPQGRLVVPAPGTVIGGPNAEQPAEEVPESSIVRAVLFPGLMLLETPTRVVEQAVVLVGPRSNPEDSSVVER